MIDQEEWDMRVADKISDLYSLCPEALRLKRDKRAHLETLTAASYPQKRFLAGVSRKLDEYNDLVVRGKLTEIHDKLDFGEVFIVVEVLDEVGRPLNCYHLSMIDMMGILFLLGVQHWSYRGLVYLPPIDFISRLQVPTLYQRVGALL